jgi:hypothetical protein
MTSPRVLRAAIPGPRTQRIAYWAGPSIFCLALYWLGLLVWFYEDDFAWLSLRGTIYDWSSFWAALFAPRAQGTIRPWSERVFFLAFESAFGLDPLPFRLWVFLTQFANLALIASIARRLTGSALAGFLAPLLWISNAALAVAMSWTSAYNQILCGFFLLSSFWLFLRWIDTGRARYYVAQWITFLLGFGALEINLVYPAIAAAYTLFCSRRHFLKTLPLFIPSILFVLAHNAAAPKVASGTYGMYYDTAALLTLLHYWTSMLSPDQARLHPAWPVFAAVVRALLSIALVAFAGWQLWRRRSLAAFLLAWFLLLIAPVLPFREHISQYYLTLPSIGIAILGAWAIACAWKAGITFRVTSLALLAGYLLGSAPEAFIVARWRYERSIKSRNLVWGVERARQLHPGKTILLAQVSSELFWSTIVDKPFVPLGIKDVFLTPGSEQNIEEHPDLGDPHEFVLPSGPARRALDHNRAVVYAVAGGRLVNITPIYRAYALTWKHEHPLRVEVGRPEYKDQLGPTWYQIEGAGHRWMPKQATVRLGAPTGPGQNLFISGYAAADQLKEGPVGMTISVNGAPYKPVRLTEPDAPFEFEFPLSKELLGQESIEISIEVDRVFTPPGDNRHLGAAFGVFAIR